MMEDLINSEFDQEELDEEEEENEEEANRILGKRRKVQSIPFISDPELEPLELLNAIKNGEFFIGEEPNLIDLWKFCYEKGCIIPTSEYCRILITEGLLYATEETLNYYLNVISDDKIAPKLIWNHIKYNCKKTRDDIKRLSIIWRDFSIRLYSVPIQSTEMRDELSETWRLCCLLELCAEFYKYTGFIFEKHISDLSDCFENYDKLTKGKLHLILPEDGIYSMIKGKYIPNIIQHWNLSHLDQMMTVISKLWTEIPISEELINIIDSMILRISSFTIGYVTEEDYKECGEFVDRCVNDVNIDDIERVKQLKQDDLMKKVLKKMKEVGLSEFKPENFMLKGEEIVIPNVEVFKQNRKKFLELMNWTSGKKNDKLSEFIGTEEVEDEISTSTTYIVNQVFINKTIDFMLPLIFEINTYKYITDCKKVYVIPCKNTDNVRLWCAAYTVAYGRSKWKSVNKSYLESYLNLLLRPGEVKRFKKIHKNVESNPLNVLNLLRSIDKKRYQDVFGTDPEVLFFSEISEESYFAQGFKTCQEYYYYICIRICFMEKVALYENLKNDMILENFIIPRHKWNNDYADEMKFGFRKTPVIFNIAGSWIVYIPTKHSIPFYIVTCSIIDAIYNMCKSLISVENEHTLHIKEHNKILYSIFKEMEYL